MEKSVEIGITEFIENMLREYIDYLPIEAIFKLWAIHEYNLEKSNKEIIKSIENFSKNAKVKKNFPETEIEYVKSTYCTRDQNKIKSIKRFTCTYHLLSAIGTKTFINAILTKYPYPVIVGFPFNEWTEKRLRKYIRLYFNMPSPKKREKLNVNLPEINTIKKALSRNRKKTGIYAYSLEDLLRYYIEKTENTEFFYMYCKQQTYPRSEKDNLAPQKKRRYNTSFFSTFFYLTNVYDYFYDVDSVSYNSDIEYIPILDYIADYAYIAKEHLKSHNLNKNPKNVIFIVNRTNFESEFIRSHNELTSIPKYRLILIDCLQELKDAIDKLNQEYYSLEDDLKTKQNCHYKTVNIWSLKVGNLDLNIDFLDKRISELSKLEMNMRIEKPKYLKKMKKITRTSH